MECGACAKKITQAVERLPGVRDVEVAVMAERLRLKLDESRTSTRRIERTVASLGYGITARALTASGRNEAPNLAGLTEHDHEHAHGSGVHNHDDPADRGKPWYQTTKGHLVLFTGALLLMAWLVKLVSAETTSYWTFVAACVIGVAPVARRAFAMLRAGVPFTIESLMTVAAIGALFIGAAEEAALVVFLFAVGEILEGVAANKARDGIRALANLVPKTALLEEQGETREVPAETLRIDQVVLVRPGDRVPADGEIVEGISGVDESPVTGESIPVTKSPGEDVFAGSINAEAVLRVRVTRAVEDNTIARIIRLVEEAEASRAPTERFIDRFSRWYMPAIVGLALLVGLIPPLLFAGAWDTWIYRALALLLIGCPCALVISVPASIASALSSGARRGLLMKGGAVLEAAAKTTHVAFDKTGTLTHGRPVVTDVILIGSASEEEALGLAAAVESSSSHPLAQAILRKAEEKGVEVPSSRDSRALPGRGVEARVGTKLVWVASPKFANEKGVLDKQARQQTQQFEETGKTTVVVFREEQPLAIIAMRDEPRSDAGEAVRQLKDLGVTSVVLTGDNQRTAAAIAGNLGMEFRAEMLPEDKLAEIRNMRQNGDVMMIGDGINDAPALKQATVGVAMGSGTDVALETADAAILRDRVTDVAATVRLSRAAMSNIRQNIAVALGLKGVFLVTSVLGITGLWIAILADTGATVLVTLNALRLLAFNPERTS